MCMPPSLPAHRCLCLADRLHFTLNVSLHASAAETQHRLFVTQLPFDICCVDKSRPSVTGLIVKVVI